MYELEFYLLVLIRVTCFIFVAPFFSMTNTPARVKITVGVFLSYLIYENSSGEQRRQALLLYGVQLIVNLLWSVFFFVFDWYLFSFFWLIALWVLIFRMIKEFYDISKIAAYINIPYLIWVTFAGYLNLGIWWLNR